jgi:hypothetical protein
MRRLRMVAILLIDASLVFGVLTFVVKLDPIMRLVAVILGIAGLGLFFWRSALKTRHESSPTRC